MAQVGTPPGVAEGLVDPTQRRFRGSAKITEYEVTKEKLGEGTFGVVSKARSKRTGKMFALKMILMHNEKEGFPITALREVKLLKMLSHPNILRLEEMAVERQQADEKGKSGKKRATLYMVTPYMDHDLSGMLTNPDIHFSEAQIKCYMLQLLEGLRYLHDAHILHRDMKAANILISNTGILQIADFGLARHYDGLTPQPRQGNGEAVRDYTSLVVTRWYRPPELLLTLKRYTPAIDMWGVGCVFGEMFELKPILEGRTDVDQCVKIFALVGSPNEESMPGWSELPGCEGHRDWDRSRGNIEERFGKRMGPHGLNLLKQLLCLDWRRRVNAIDALQHEYFTTAPSPARPGDLPQYEDSHELDNRRKDKEQRKPPAAPQGGQVGMGPEEWNGGPVNGNYQNGGYYDRGPRGYGRDRGPPGNYGQAPVRNYEDRRGPPPPNDTSGRLPAWRQHDRERDRGSRQPSQAPGNGLPPKPAGLPPKPEIPARGPPPATRGPDRDRDRERGGVDTYIPAYQERSGHDGRLRESFEQRGGRDDGYQNDRDAPTRDYRDRDAPQPARAYHDRDAPSGGRADQPRDRNYASAGRDDRRRTRSRSPDRERRERLQDRERDFYRR